MSCTNGTNKDLFLTEIQQVTQALMGKRPITLTFSYQQHDKVTRWLFEHASISSVDDVTYRDDGLIDLRVPIDEVVYHQYLKHFENERFEDKRGGARDNKTTAIKKGRLAPPPGWNNKSS
jgi:predicted YcjX-like family ATPase